MTKRIAIDARMWRHPGIGRYICELVDAMMPQIAADYSLTCFAGDEFTARFILEEFKPTAEKASSSIYGISEQFEMLSKAKQFDLLHVPHFNIPIFSRTPLVVTVHDLTYLREPNAAGSPLGRAYVRYLFKMIEKKAAHVITVSEFTKNDLLNAFPKIRPERVTVTHEACSKAFVKMGDTPLLQKMRQKFKKPFVLFVGTLKPHKNVPALLEAMERVRGRGLDHELVLAGRKDEKNAELLKKISRLPWVRVLGEVPDAELCCLYNLADLFVLPSLREGFGLPVLEAMSCGAPVICSDLSSLPEIAGDAALLFDPLRIDALEELLYNVLNNRDLREKMSKRGTERAGHFSWQSTAERTLQVYRRALG